MTGPVSGRIAMLHIALRETGPVTFWCLNVRHLLQISNFEPIIEGMNFKKLKDNNQGQAVTEYILVLIVLVFVFLLLLQFNQQFRKWGEDYFISYYRCLLETGELPSLSGGNNTNGICAGEFQAFTFTGGWQPYPGGAGSTGGSGGGSDGNGSGSGGNSASKVRQKSTGESGGNSRGGEVSRVAGRSGHGAGRFDKFKTSQDSGDESGANAKGKRKGIYTGSGEVSNLGSNKSAKSKRRKTKGLEYGFGVKRDKQERGVESSKISIKKKEAERQQKKRFRVMKKMTKKKTTLEDDEFTFGSFFRLLIIAAIIIALGVLIGGQLLQISKGMDAEG